MLMLVLILMVMVLLSIAFITLLERKIFGYMQIRKGPNKLFYKGVSQPLADGMKLFLKENYNNLNVNKMFFYFFPFLGFSLMLSFWLIFNFFYYEVFLFSVIFFMLISGVGVYSILGAGWSSNSKYSLLGSYRSVAQTISYEVVMVFIMISIIYFTSNYCVMNLEELNKKSLILGSGFWFFYFIWFVVILAELNRSPFDFAEGESELVSGFNVEYGAGKFALIFLAEYGNIIFMSYISVTIFMEKLFNVSLIMFMFLVLWVRGTFPRFRYDNLMSLTWKIYLPLVLVVLLMVCLLVYLY